MIYCKLQIGCSWCCGVVEMFLEGRGLAVKKAGHTKVQGSSSEGFQKDAFSHAKNNSITAIKSRKAESLPAYSYLSE